MGSGPSQSRLESWRRTRRVCVLADASALWGFLSSHLRLDCRIARSYTAYGMRHTYTTHRTCIETGDTDGTVTDRRVTSYDTRYFMARPVPTWQPVTHCVVELRGHRIYYVSKVKMIFYRNV